MSGGVGLLARVALRRRRASIAWLALLVGLVGTVVVAPLIGARRTLTASDRQLSADRYWDVILDALTAGPEVISQIR